MTAISSEAMSPELLERLSLKHGGHTLRKEGMCLLEAVAFLSGEEHSDHPTCVDTAVGNFARSLNDFSPPSELQGLRMLIPRLSQTATDPRATNYHFYWTTPLQAWTLAEAPAIYVEVLKEGLNAYPRAITHDLREILTRVIVELTYRQLTWPANPRDLPRFVPGFIRERHRRHHVTVFDKARSSAYAVIRNARRDLSMLIQDKLRFFEPNVVTDLAPAERRDTAAMLMFASIAHHYLGELGHYGVAMLINYAHGIKNKTDREDHILRYTGRARGHARAADRRHVMDTIYAAELAVHRNAVALLEEILP